jgi:hypothetical protein
MVFLFSVYWMSNGCFLVPEHIFLLKKLYYKGYSSMEIGIGGRGIDPTEYVIRVYYYNI